MTTLAEGGGRAQPSDFCIAGPVQFLGQLAAIALRHLRLRDDRRQMETMPDYLLRDLGLTRYEVRQMTRNGRPRAARELTGP